MKRKARAHEKRIVGARQGWRCAACHRMLPSTFECDHVVALWRGGPDELDNLQALCCECHAAKTQLEEVERMQRLKALRAASTVRAPLCCIRCHAVVSPYFEHRC